MLRELGSADAEGSLLHSSHNQKPCSGVSKSSDQKRMPSSQSGHGSLFAGLSAAFLKAFTMLGISPSTCSGWSPRVHGCLSRGRQLAQKSMSQKSQRLASVSATDFWQAKMAHFQTLVSSVIAILCFVAGFLSPLLSAYPGPR